jgi:hypothetical protein
MEQNTSFPGNKKKNQHYVPRMYLRNFASGEKKAISLYNLPSKRVVSCAPIKHQCSAPYFYGQDLKLEDALEDIEGLIASVISGIISTNALPRNKSNDHFHLILFTLFQYARTKEMANAHNDIADKFLKAVLEKEGSFDQEALKAVTIELTEPAQLALSSAAQSYYLLLDLKMKVLINSTEVEFVTSDNPVIFYNQYLEKSDPRLGSNTGLVSKGLQIFLPLSPKHLLTLYDGTVYKIGDRRSDSCNVTDPNDVRQFNDLQYLNCLENLYAYGGFSGSDIFFLDQRNAKRKRNPKATLNQYEQGGRSDGLSSVLLHVMKSDCRINLSLQSIRQLVKVSIDELNAHPRPVRNPQMVRVYNEFRAQVKAEKYHPGEFHRYVNDVVSSQRQFLAELGTRKSL